MTRNHIVVAVVAAVAGGALAIAGGSILSSDDDPKVASNNGAVAKNVAPRTGSALDRRAAAESGAAPDIALAEGCNTYVPGVGENLPRGASIDFYAFAGFRAPATQADARAVVAEVAGIPIKQVECFDSVPEDGPAAAQAAAGSADAAESSPAGSGSCSAQVALDPKLQIPDGVNVQASADGFYENHADEAATRAELARIANVAEDAVECSFYVPPAGSCWVDLTPLPDDPPLPEGATLNGSASVDYLKAGDREQARKALEAFARGGGAKITCEDFSDEPKVRAGGSEEPATTP